MKEILRPVPRSDSVGAWRSSTQPGPKRLSDGVMKTRPEIANGIDARIVLVRDHRVMLDVVLAELYGVPTKALKQAVRRNLERFPADFMFPLAWEEVGRLRSQNVTLENSGQERERRGAHVKYPPYAFTEQGVAMLSSVLRSKRAVRVNIEIMRAFVRLRALLVSNADLARKLAALERKYDAQFKVVFDAIRELMAPPEPKSRRPIGFISGG